MKRQVEEGFRLSDIFWIPAIIAGLAITSVLMKFNLLPQGKK